MSRQSANPTFNITWNKDLNEGATLEGYYIKKELVSSKFGGQKSKYVIETKDGTLYDVFTSTTLERQFNNIPEGVYVWITYNGETVSKNGRTVKLYTVEFDDEDVK